MVPPLRRGDGDGRASGDDVLDHLRTRVITDYATMAS